MTKKVDSKGIGAGNDGPVKICFERIIPDDLDPERSVRRALREQMAASARKPLNAAESAHIARMAVINSKKWHRWSCPGRLWSLPAPWIFAPTSMPCCGLHGKYCR